MKHKLNYLAIGVVLFAAAGMMQSCRTPKEQEPISEEVVDHGSEPVNLDHISGTVRVTDDCGAYIEVIKGDVAHSYYPVNLDSRYQVEGMRLKFAFELSKTKPPVACPNFEPITVSDVTPLR